MECIFLSVGKKCTAHLPQFAPSTTEVDDDTLKKYCQTEKFDLCPKYKAYVEFTHAEKK